MAFVIYRNPVRSRCLRYALDPFDEEFDDPFLTHYQSPRWRRYRPYVSDGRYFIRNRNEENGRCFIRNRNEEKFETKEKKLEGDAVVNGTKEQSVKQAAKDLLHYLWFCPASSEENDTQTPQKSSDSLREVFPFSMSPSGTGMNCADDVPFQVNANLSGCDPDKISIDIKDGILKIEGKSESDGNFIRVTHEQTLPKDISPSSLVASFLSDGTLSIRQKTNCNIPVTFEGQVSEGQNSNVEDSTDNH